MKLTRRQNALKRLENQLVSGVKPITKHTLMHGDFGNAPIPTVEPLTDKDVTRIKKEISILKTSLNRN